MKQHIATEKLYSIIRRLYYGYTILKSVSFGGKNTAHMIQSVPKEMHLIEF